MATFEFTLRGDQIGTFSSYSGAGNNQDRVLTINDVAAIGSSLDTYTVRVEQAQVSDTQFTNGQMITILDASGNVVTGPTGIQPGDEVGLFAGDEHLVIRNSNLLIDLGGLNAGPETVQYSYEDEAADLSYGDNDGELDFADVTTSFPCFGRSTLIRTPQGERLIEDLCEGDLVTTLDNGPQPIVWMRRRIIRSYSRDDGDLPILVPASSFGLKCPALDLVVSPQHSILVFGLESKSGSGLLVPAKALSGGSIRTMRGRRSFEYFALLLPSHNLIWANSCLCESTYPGDFLMGALSPSHRSSLFDRFPLLRLGAELGYGPRARQKVSVQKARKLFKAARSSKAALA